MILHRKNQENKKLAELELKGKDKRNNELAFKVILPAPKAHAL